MVDKYPLMNPASLRDYLATNTGLESLLARFSERALPSTTKYIENRASPATAVKDCIETLRDRVNVGDIVFSLDESNSAFASNLSLFISQAFWNHFDRFRPLLAIFDYDDSIGFVLNRSNVMQLTEKMAKDPSIKLSPSLALLMAMSASHYEININKRCEIQFIKDLSASMLIQDYSSVAQTILAKRIQSLIKDQQHTKAPTKPHALMITGQLRGYKKSLPLIWRTITDPANTDVYISTWLNPGSATIDPQRLPRRFTPEAVALLETHRPAIDISALRTYVQHTEIQLGKPELENALIELFPGARSVRINVIDGDDYPYSSMDNPTKMHFHNAYWIETLGKELFNETYGIITKIRPDYQLSKFPNDTSDIFGDSILSADLPGWVLDVWGFGMADQMFSGHSKVMTELLTIKFPHNISTLAILRLMRLNRNFMGHVNLAIEAWTMGITPSQIRHKKFSFSEVDKLDENYVREYIEGL